MSVSEKFSVVSIIDDMSVISISRHTDMSLEANKNGTFFYAHIHLLMHSLHQKIFTLFIKIFAYNLINKILIEYRLMIIS